MGIDRRLIERLLREMLAQVRLLEGALRLPRQDLLSDPLRAYGVLYALQCAIEALSSAGHHIVAECDLPAPEGNRDLAGILGANRVIEDMGLLERLPRIIRFRNLLVHRYWQVDYAIVMDIIERNLGDFAAFALEVERWLDKLDTPPQGSTRP